MFAYITTEGMVGGTWANGGERRNGGRGVSVGGVGRQGLATP